MRDGYGCWRNSSRYLFGYLASLAMPETVAANSNA
jgi:hypothetical protein